MGNPVFAYKGTARPYKGTVGCRVRSPEGWPRLAVAPVAACRCACCSLQLRLLQLAVAPVTAFSCACCGLLLRLSVPHPSCVGRHWQISSAPCAEKPFCCSLGLSSKGWAHRCRSHGSVVFWGLVHPCSQVGIYVCPKPEQKQTLCSVSSQWLWRNLSTTLSTKLLQCDPTLSIS